MDGRHVETPGGALSGTRVLELASYVSGPYAGLLLADLGADVIKIEEPERGDPFRGWGENNYSPTFCGLNRNKRSVALDLGTDEGQTALVRLIATADVLIENYRPGVAERLGFGYDAAQALNPRLVHCSISGFGSSGPYRDRPGYDTVGQAISGLLSLLTDLDDPKPMGLSLSDHLTGIFACYGILGALLARERTGEGQKVETSLLQATIAFTAESAARYFATGEVPSRSSRGALAGVLTARGSDGLPFVIHLSSPAKFWTGLLAAVGRPELAEDSRFRTRSDRQKNYRALLDELNEAFSTAPRSVWLDRLQAEDVPCGALNTMDYAFADPQVQHLRMRTTAQHPRFGAIDLVAPGVSLGNTPLDLRRPPPELGEHTDEVLAELDL